MPPVIALGLIGTVVIVGGRFSKRAVQIGFLLLLVATGFLIHDYLAAYPLH